MSLMDVTGVPYAPPPPSGSFILFLQIISRRLSRRHLTTRNESLGRIHAVLPNMLPKEVAPAQSSHPGEVPRPAVGPAIFKPVKV
jgi:hypothetical protein